MARILVIDDDRDILAMSRKILEELGHQVLLASNVREGLILNMIWHPVDVILTDIFMPDMDGLELISCISRLSHQAEGEQEPKIIAMTSDYHILAKTVTLRTARCLGAIATLAKPFRPQDLQARLATALV